MGFYLALLVFFMVVFAGHSSADDRFKDDPEKPWHIVADEIGYDDRTNQYIARGNVTVTKESKTLSADYVRFDQKNMKVFAEGHVLMTLGKDLLTGSSLEMDLNSEKGSLYNGTIFFEENHYYIKGDKIEKTGKDSYIADKASITTCDGDRPAWKITGRKLNVTIEGYGFVNHAALWAKKIPLLYTPFLIFPVKLKRQSGLLFPQFGFSDRKGEEYVQPLYWAINDSSDATVYFHYLQKRGIKLGLEYRYVLDSSSKGTLMYDFLDDKQVDDGSENSSENWGYTDDDTLRPNSDRYWFRMKLDQGLPYGFSAKLDLDVVSDQDYLNEFKRGYTGFEKTRDYFITTYGRDIDGYDDPVRLNRLNLNRNWAAYSLNAELRWFDNVINRRQTETDETLQRLPIIEFDGLKQQLLKSPLSFDLNSEYTYFYREDGPTGQRIDVYPRLYLPYNFGNYFTFEPSIGLRGTAWYLDKEEFSPSNEKTLSRGIYDLKLDFFSEVYRTFPGIGDYFDRVKHTVRPQIVYDFTPEKDQDEYPFFDELDRIARQNLVTYSVTNTFTSRTQKKGQKLDGSSSGEDDNFNGHLYNQFLRFKLQQSFDINKEKENDPEPFSPISGEVDITPVRYFLIDADAQWSHYDRRFRSHNVAATLWDNRGDRLFVEHRYTINSTESIYTELLLKITDRLSALTEYERDIRDEKDIKFGLGFLYESQCWSLNLRYIDEEDDRRYEFMIDLYGIGGFGEGIAGTSF
jgi:LPS-assembly protein